MGKTKGKQGRVWLVAYIGEFFSLNLQFRGILNKLKHFADQHSLKQKKQKKTNKQKRQHIVT